VSVDVTFSDSLSHLKKLLVRKFIERWLTVGILLYLISILAVLLFGRMLPQPTHLREVFLIALAGSFAVAAIFAAITKKGVLDELIATDIRFSLKEKLSTAYEYYSKGRVSVFSEVLFQNASRILKRLDYRHIHERKIFPQYFLMGVIVLIIILTQIFNFDTESQPQLQYTSERQFKAARNIEAFVKEKIENTEGLTEKNPEPVQQELRRLIKIMKDPSVSQEEVAEEIKKTLASVQATKASEMNNLGDQLSFGNKAESRELKALKKGKVTPNELKQLEKQLGKMFEDGVPESVSKDIASMRQHQALESILKKSLDELGESISGEVTDKDSESGEEEGKLISKSKTNQPASDGDAKVPEDKGVIGSTQEEPGEGSTDDSSPSGNRPGEQNPDGRMPFDDFPASSAGKNKSEWKQKEKSALAKTKKSENKIEGQSGQGNWYNVKIRSLTNAGDVKMTREQIRRTYQKDLENTLLKEEIPLNMRNYIKNYFLSIGLRKEKK